jgi:hypothetical protein
LELWRIPLAEVGVYIMIWLDWFVMELFCYPLFIDIIIMDIQRINDRINCLEKHGMINWKEWDGRFYYEQHK